MNPLPLPRVTLVERKDKPGALGVWLQGGRVVCALPDGYDGRTAVALHKGYVLVSHPDLPPLRCDPNTGGVALIEPGHIKARDGRMKLVTQ